MATEHFDRRAATYDADRGHRRIVEALMARVNLKPQMRVLDVATGTGAVAFRAAQIVGALSNVVAIDVSDGMLVEARRKAIEAGLENIQFVQADAEEIDLPAESFDCVLMGSGLIFLRDIPGMLRRCFQWLVPGGSLAFDMPAKPFGLSEWIAEAAIEEGIFFRYDSVADTPEKCRVLLDQAGFTEIAIHAAVVSDDVVAVQDAIEFLDQRLDHPAWQALREASEVQRREVRSSSINSLHRRADAGMVRSTVAQNFAYGRRK